MTRGLAWLMAGMVALLLPGVDAWAVEVEWGDQVDDNGNWSANWNGGGPTIDWTETVGTDLAPEEGYTMNQAINDNWYNFMTGRGQYFADDGSGESSTDSGSYDASGDAGGNE